MSEREVDNIRILVVDDEERIRDACGMVLEQEGYQVFSADNGELGLKMIEEQHFDLMLLDLMMPVLSGFDMLPILKEKHPDTAVIVITGYATVEHSIEAMKKGAFDFIPKPFTTDQLRSVVAKTIKYTRALQDISDSKSRLHGMVNRLRDGVMTTDSNKNIVLANPAFLFMIGYTGESVIGKQVNQIITCSPLLEIIDEALEMAPDSIAEANTELEVKLPSDAEPRIFSARCSPFRNRNQQLQGTTTVLHDITTLKKMDQMKSDFVSMVSHEIRSPMNSLLAQIKVLRDGLAGDVTPKQDEILGRAAAKMHNLVNLSSDLLDLARIEAGATELEKISVDIPAFLREQVAFHEAAANEKKITLSLDAPEKLPAISVNQQGLEEVMTNLIGNGIKYSPEGASLFVTAEVQHDYLAIVVRDTGYGIPKEDVDRIFTRFYRVKDQNTREIQGPGLGLAIVKTIIEAHQGSIKVESEYQKGTTFTVLLPLL